MSRNVSICFEFRAETRVKTPKIQDPGTSRNVSECLGFPTVFSSRFLNIQANIAKKNAKKRLGMSRFVSGVETFRDVFSLYLLIYLKARRKNGRKPETFRDIPRRSGVLDFRRFDSSFRSKFETDRDIPRHSGALDFRRFDSSFRSTVRSGLRSTLRRPGSSYFRKKHRAFFFSPRSRSGRHHRLLQGRLRPSRIGRLLCCRRSKR